MTASPFNRGGVIPTPAGAQQTLRIQDDECLLAPILKTGGRFVCQRTDTRHTRCTYPPDQP